VIRPLPNVLHFDFYNSVNADVTSLHDGGVPSHRYWKPNGGLKITIDNATEFDTRWLHNTIKKYARVLGVYWPIYFQFTNEGWSEIYHEDGRSLDEYSYFLGTNNCFDELICEIWPNIVFPQKFGMPGADIYCQQKKDLAKFIIAHELCHLTVGHPENFSYDKAWDGPMEKCCNQIAKILMQS